MAAVPAGLPFRAGSGVPAAFHLFNCQGPRKDCFLSPHFYWQKNRRFHNQNENIFLFFEFCNSFADRLLCDAHHFRYFGLRVAF